MAADSIWAISMSEAGWEVDVGRQLGLGGPVQYTTRPGSRHHVLHLKCTVDDEVHDVDIPRRFPTEVLLKKLQEKGWDITRGKVRCPTCKMARRRMRVLSDKEHPDDVTLDVTPRKEDIKVETLRASTSGGQRANTTETGVRITHLPTGIQAVSRRRRSQAQNKSAAMHTLKERLEEHFKQDLRESDRMPKTGRKSAEDIRLGITDSVMIAIGRNHPLFSRFANEDNKAIGHWSIELRSNPDLKGDPFIAIIKQNLPPGKRRVDGIFGGSYNKINDSFLLSVKTKQIKNIGLLGQFRTAPVEYIEENGNIILKPPKDRKAPQLRGNRKIEAEAIEHEVLLKEPERPKPLPQELPVRQTVAPIPKQEPEPQHAPFHGQVVVQIPPIQMPDRFIMSPSPANLSVEKCIDYLNKVKQQKGSDLTFRIEEGGYLTYFMRGGRGR